MRGESCNIVCCTHLLLSGRCDSTSVRLHTAAALYSIYLCGRPRYVLMFTPPELMTALLQSFRINPSGQQNANTHTHTPDTHIYTYISHDLLKEKSLKEINGMYLTVQGQQKRVCVFCGCVCQRGEFQVHKRTTVAGHRHIYALLKPVSVRLVKAQCLFCIF